MILKVEIKIASPKIICTKCACHYSNLLCFKLNFNPSFYTKFKEDKVIKDADHLSKTHFSLMFIYKHLCKSPCMVLVLSQVQ